MPGPLEVIAALGVLFVLVVALRVARSSNTMMSTVVLTKFELSENPPFLVINGRTPGLLGFFLKIAGVGSITQFCVSNVEVRMDFKSLTGGRLVLVPGEEVSVVRARYHTPVWALILMFAVVMLTLVPVTVLFVQDTVGPDLFYPTLYANGLIVGLCAVIYVFGKKCALMVDTYASKGPTLGISFKPSILDGAKVNITQLNQAANMINLKIAQQDE